ncbi:hypothetical protein LSCM1_03701 [Leishmania martiniquensis]|uniref:Uncharacterized protein n=1 Tax=Leishmania martiniquensis TaxID=1580590 RepID=A0A836FZP1_9TRYP|nr:hypothetical protein LSCM1_03701 [Leishmania martiniquensis]
MSGFWSFRESVADSAAAARLAKERRPLDLAVTQVLPVGVEFKRAMLSTSHEDARGRFRRKTLPCAEATGQIRETDRGPVTRLARKGDLSSSQSTAAEADDAVVDEGRADAHLMDHDEVIDAVQRKWWEALGADVSPGSLLPSAEMAPTIASIPDEETLGLVQNLLSHASGSTPSKAAARLHDSALLSCEVLLHKKRERRARFSRSPAPDAQVTSRQSSEHTASCSVHSAVPCEPLLHTGKLAHLRPRRSSTARAPHSEGKIDRSKTGGCSHQDHGGAAKGPAVVSHLFSRPEGERSFAGERSTGAGTATPVEKQSEVFLPSAILQSVLRTRTRGLILSSTTATRVEAVRRREELLLLRHYFALWLAAADQRHIQQCTASYHCFLMQCVNETLGNATSQLAEQGIHG